MADSVVDMKDNKFITLVLQNSGVEKEYLEKGAQLGVVSTAAILSQDKRESPLKPGADLARLRSTPLSNQKQEETSGRDERVAKLLQ